MSECIVRCVKDKDLTPKLQLSYNDTLLKIYYIKAFFRL